MLFGTGIYGGGALYGGPTDLGDTAATLRAAASLPGRASTVQGGSSAALAQGTVEARPVRLRSSEVPLVSRGTVAAPAQRIRNGSRSLVAKGALAAGASRLQTAPATLPGTSVVGARWTGILGTSALLAGNAAAAALPGRVRSALSGLAGNGTVEARPQRLRSETRTLLGSSGMAAIAARILSLPSALPGDATIPAQSGVLAGGRIGLVSPATLSAIGSRVRGLATIDIGGAYLSARPGRVRQGTQTAVAVAVLYGRGSRIVSRIVAVQGQALLSARRTTLLGSSFAAVARASTTLSGMRLRSIPFTGLARAAVEGQLNRFTFTSDNARFYWDAGLGHAPILGGEPFFARDSAAVAADRRDVLRQLIRDVARFEWVGTDDQRRQALLLEMARSNKCPRNVDFATGGTAGWTLGGPGAAKATLTVVDDRRKLNAAGLVELVPDGTVLRLDNRAGTAEAWVVSTGPAGALTPHTGSVYWRGTGSARIGVGAPTGTTAALPTEYQRASRTQTPAATTAAWTAAAAPGTDLYLVLPQLEEGDSMTSPIRNPSTGVPVRLAEQFGWSSPPSPAGSATYVRWTAAMPGAGGLTAPRVLEFSQVAESAPRVAVRYTSAGIDVLLDNGTTQATAAVAASIPTGAEVEVLLFLQPGGSGRLAVSVNRGTPVGADVAAPAGGLPATWERLWLNGIGTAGIGTGRYQQAKVVTGVPHTSDVGRMVALRGFEISPNGEVL